MLMDKLSERGNSHLLKVLMLKLQLLSCDKRQDSVAFGKSSMRQLVWRIDHSSSPHNKSPSSWVYLQSKASIWLS